MSEAELTRVKTQWIAGEIYKLDSVMSQARELGSNWIQGLPLDAERPPDRSACAASRRSRCKAVAAKYFGDDQLTVGALRPQPVDPTANPARPRRALRH